MMICTRYQLYKILKKIPIVKKKAFRIVIFLFPIKKEEWKRVIKWLDEEVEE